MVAGAPSPDRGVSVGVAELAALHNTKRAEQTKIPQKNIDEAKILSDAMAQKKSFVDILTLAAEGEAKAEYQLDSPQQDIARLGGDGGKLQDGIMIPKDGIEQKQKDRLEKGQKAIQDVSAVMFYMDLVKLQEAGGSAQEAIDKLQDNNPSFKALEVEDFDALQRKVQTTMLASDVVKQIIAKMEQETGLKFGLADQEEIVCNTILTEPNFRDKLSANLHTLHEKLLKLPPAIQEGGAKVKIEKDLADKKVTYRSVEIAERLSRLKKAESAVFRELTPTEVEDLIKGSGTEKDFRKNLAVQLGVAQADNIAQYIENEQEIAKLQKRLTDESLDSIVTPVVDKSYGQNKTGSTDRPGPLLHEKTQNKVVEGPQVDRIRQSISALEGKQRALEALNQVDFDKQLATYKRISSFVEGQEVKGAVSEGINASIEAAKLKEQIKASSGGEISTSLDTRLSQEDKIIKDFEKVIGKSLAQAWKENMEVASTEKAELMKKRIAEASTEDEKELLRRIDTNFVEYDIDKRETTIHGKEIIKGMKLIAMKDKGTKLEMARMMGYVQDDEIRTLFETTGAGDIKKGETAAYMQQKAVDALLDSIPEEKKAVLEKMFIDHGSELKQKIYGSYLTMDEYIKENGILGFAMRVGRKVKYDGPIRHIKDMIMGTGDSIVNKDELAAIFKYCKQDIEDATKSNTAANSFIRGMESKGMVGNPDLLKKLAWFLFVILGLGGGGLAAIPGGISALAGAGIGSGIGAVGLGAAKVIENKTVTG